MHGGECGFGATYGVDARPLTDTPSSLKRVIHSAGYKLLSSDNASSNHGKCGTDGPHTTVKDQCSLLGIRAFDDFEIGI